MTLVTAALDRIARQVSVNTPTSWVTATEDEYAEIRDDFLLETVEDLLDRVDMPSPIGKTQDITSATTNSGGDYELNSDFRRLQRADLSVYDVNQDRPCIPVSDDGQWEYLTDIGASGADKYYRLKGYEGNWTLGLYNTLGSGETVTVSYVSDLWLVNSGSYKSAFTDPDDTLLFPRRVIEAGTVWRWRERKGLPYLDKMNEYEMLLARMVNDGRSRKAINMGGTENVRWQDLVPSYIPSS